MRFDVGLPLSVQARRVGWSSPSPHIKDEGIPVLHTLLAFNAVTKKMKRLIKSMAFVSCNANEEVAVCEALSRSHLQSMTGSLLWTWQQNILLGCILFISSILNFASLWFLSYLASLFLLCFVCSLRNCMMTQSWKFCKSSLSAAIKSFKFSSMEADSD